MVLRWSVFVVLSFAFILVPFVLLEGRMNELVQHTLQSSVPLTWITLAVVAFFLADIVLPVLIVLVLRRAAQTPHAQTHPRAGPARAAARAVFPRQERRTGGAGSAVFAWECVTARSH